MPRPDTGRRREEILHLASTEGTTSVDVLAARFGVTASTIRRDLARLTGSGRLARTYGGAIALPGREERSLRQRLGEAHEAKRAIARWARRRVGDGERIFLDAGSTVSALAEECRGAPDLTVTTVSLTVVDALADEERVRVDCVGGRLRPLSRGFVGPIAEASVERLTFDSAFLGTDGVHARLGLCEAELEQTRLKELVAHRSRAVFVLAHAAKLGAAPFHAWARLEAPWTLVTDDAATEEQLAPFRDAGVEVVAVPPAH